MKSKILFLSLAIIIVAIAAWMSRDSEPAAAQPSAAPDKYGAMLTKGLEFLAKQQAKDGHWEGDDGKHPVAMTGFVGIALLSERTSRLGRGQPEYREGKHPESIYKATAWLLELGKADRDGLLYSGHPSERTRYMEGHGLATIFLAGVCKDAGRMNRKELTEVLTRAVKYIERSQSSQGGWSHTSKLEGHDFDAVLPTAIQIQALQAAQNAGIPISAGVLDRAQEYMTKAAEKHAAATDAPLKRVRLANTTLAMATHYHSINDVIPPAEKRWDKWNAICEPELRVDRKIAFGVDDLNHYYFAQSRLYAGTDARKSYQEAIREQLRGVQAADGGWPTSVGISSGRVYATALWCTLLQLENQHYPSMERMAVDIT